MNKNLLRALSCVLLTSVVSCGSKHSTASQVTMTPFTDERVDAMVDSLYNIMSDEERIAQLQGFRQQELYVDGKLSLQKCRELMPNGIGHISQYAVMMDQTPSELRDNVKKIRSWQIK